MTNSPTITTVPRAAYAGAMAATVVAGALASYLVAWAMGEPGAAGWAAGVVGGGSLISLAPVIIPAGKDPRWFGLIVFGASFARLLAIVALAFAVSQVRPLETQPFGLAIAVGAVLVLIVESIAAVAVIGRLERARTSGAAAAPQHAPEGA